MTPYRPNTYLVSLVEPWVASVGGGVGRYSGHQHGQVLVSATLDVETKLATFVRLHFDGDEAMGTLLTPSRLHVAQGGREEPWEKRERGERRELSATVTRNPSMMHK